MTTNADIKNTENRPDMARTQSVHSEKSINFQGNKDKRKVFVKGGEAMSRVHYRPDQAPSFDEEIQDTLMLSPSNHSPIKAQRSFIFRASQTLGILGSIAWVALCVTYFILEGAFATQTPYELGIFVAGILSPIAFYWMLLSYLQRNSDVQYYAESLRSELHTLFFPSEEDSQHVNKDIERMTAQAAELAASSKAALKAIHRTRQGLHHEIKEFSNLARKAETHLISLSDNLMERTGDMGGIVDAMDDRINEMDKKSRSSITSWDEASARMVERASEIEASMDSGANRIMSMAEVAQEKSKAVSENFDGTITSLGLTVDAVIDRLGGINDEFGTYTRTLQNSTEELSKETGRMGSMIEDQIDQLQDASGRSVETITQSLMSMSDHKLLLEESADILTTKANDIATSVSDSVSKLTDATDILTTKANDTELRLSEKSESISTTLNSFSSEIDRIDSLSELANHRLAQGIETAVNGASNISDAIHRGVDLLTKTSNDTMSEASSLIDATVNHIQQLKDVGQGNVSSVEAMVDLLEQSRQQIEKSSLSAQNHVNVLSKSVETQSDKLEMSAVTLSEQVKSVTRALEEPLRMVGVAIADADGRHIQIQETLERRTKDLRDASDKATESVEVIRQSLREQTQDISSLSGRIISQSKTLNDELSENKEYLTSTVEMTLTDMKRFMNGLSGVTTSIKENSSEIINNVALATDTIEISANRLQDASLFTQQALSHSGHQFEEQAKILETVIYNADEIISKTTQDIEFSSDKILPLYDRIEKGSNNAVTSLNEFKDIYIDVASTTMDKINDATLQFDDRLFKLQSGSIEASETLKSTSDNLRQRLDDIENAASSASDKMHTLSNAMQGQSSDIHILTDQATLRIENIQSLVNDQFQELSSSVGQAVNQIEEAGNKFDVRSEKITSNAQLITDGFTSAGNEATAKAYELKQASQNVSDISNQSVVQITKSMEVLNQKSSHALSDLRKTSDTLSIKSQEVDVMMKTVLSQAKSYAIDMREQVKAVAVQSDETASHVGKSISKLLGTMDDVNGKTKSVVTFIQDTNQSLYDQSGRFITAVSKSVQATEQATDLFSQQTDNLLKASRVAVEKMGEIKKTQLRVGRETFLSSARFVLESLHSLSIDFVRIIDGEVDEKEWKSYQKGDIALFTTKVAARLNDMPIDKIREKYAQDTEFRNYTQKFMRQFEDVLEQTDTVDRGAVLGTTFAASDVGKIYNFLCNVTGRNIKSVA